MMRRTLGVIFQDFRLIEKKTVYENLAFVMRAVGMPKKEIKQRIPYVLQLVGLEKKAENYPQRAFRRRAAAGGHRPGAGEQPQLPSLPTSPPAIWTRSAPWRS